LTGSASLRVSPRSAPLPPVKVAAIPLTPGSLDPADLLPGPGAGS